MAVLDRYVEELSKQKADAIVFSANKLVDLRVGAEVRPLTRTPVSAEQLIGLLEEAFGPEVSIKLTTGTAVFQHQSPSGTVSVTAVRSAQGLTVTLEPSARGTPVASRPITPPAIRPVAVTPSAVSPASLGPPSIPPPRKDGTNPRIDIQGMPSLDDLLNQMIDMGASDLHLKTGKAPVVRVDGSLKKLEGRPRLTHEVLTKMLLAVAPERNAREYEKYFDTDFAYEIPRARVRANIFKDHAGIGACFRQIPRSIRTARELSIPPAAMNLCDLKKGLVLVTGPTGCGKSTTLAAMINYVNENRDAHIITVEDPIEFLHEEKRAHLNQREVGTQTRNFKTALRAALREDPDIVLVGEMRDLETVEMAIETAETGHLVFGTLHTNTAASTVDRIINQFPADRQPQIRTMLADSLRGVVAQALVKKKGGGRIAAMEIMLVNTPISNLIREGKTYQIGGIMQTSRNAGMQMLNDALVELVKAGSVDAREAFEHSQDQKEYIHLLSRAGIKVNFGPID